MISLGPQTQLCGMSGIKVVDHGPTTASFHERRNEDTTATMNLQFLIISGSSSLFPALK